MLKCEKKHWKAVVAGFLERMDPAAPESSAVCANVCTGAKHGGKENERTCLQMQASDTPTHVEMSTSMLICSAAEILLSASCAGADGGPCTLLTSVSLLSSPSVPVWRLGCSWSIGVGSASLQSKEHTR